MQEYIILRRNNEAILFGTIPELDYADFLDINAAALDSPGRHCASLFGMREGSELRLICCVADDSDGAIRINSAKVDPTKEYPSLSARRLAYYMFEREIWESFGLRYSDHPWLKPVRYSHDRFDLSQTISNYPFYSIHSEELHEVGVGPIHAGVIEPGHFRFICKGEQIQHMEIQLGYQHRGVEKLFLEKNFLGRALLAESIAGDAAAGHATAHAELMEALSGVEASKALRSSRALAIELERIAVHTGDLSAICGDVAYQLGASVFGRLRTPVINFTQRWCGNRLGKGLIRPGYVNYTFTKELNSLLNETFDKFEPDFEEMIDEFFHNPGCLSRLEKTGVVTANQAEEIGAVGMAAKASGLSRDIRSSHPDDAYKELMHRPTVKRHGDVYSRTQIRREEVIQSIGYARKLGEAVSNSPAEAPLKLESKPDLFAVSLVEGWRGEICHCAVTGDRGELIRYKVKDPSFHNWLALALAVRKNEISDFPICNKSFNLSYCGFDL
ncbi:MAG: NADH-quinone oxidoreductase subunit C [Chloroflexota bacterium]